MTTYRFARLLPFLFALNAYAATATLSQRGIMALDYRVPGVSAAILHAEASLGGVEYTVKVRSRVGTAALFSQSDNGKGLLLEMPWIPGDKFGLRFTLLPNGVPGMTLAPGVLLNGAYGRAELPKGQATVDLLTAKGAGGTTVEMVRFHLDFSTPADVAWPQDGAVVRVLVEPIAGATQLQPSSEPSPLPDAAPGRTITLNASDLAILEVPRHGSGNASLVSAVASESGVLYTLRFGDKRGSIALEVPSNSPLLGTRLSGSDSFALKFTVKDTTPELDSAMGAGVYVNSRRPGFAPVYPGTTHASGLTSDTGTSDAVLRKLGIVVYVPPSEEGKWPSAGGTVQILVEPAPYAYRISALNP